MSIAFKGDIPMSPIDKPRKRVGNPEQKQPTSSRKWIYIGVVIVIVVVAAVAFVMLQNLPSNTKNNVPSTPNPIAVISTSMGTIRVELFQDKVPLTCQNFINLAKSGFYDGLVFHRVINHFMIQGGGFYPNGTQKTEPYGPINLEINPVVHHVDGTIAMARTTDPNSATSQFFIDDGNQSQLEPGGVDAHGYAAFGVVVQGIEVVRNIAAVQTTTRYGMQDWPINDVLIISITIEE
jgi:cyclophilin family peptidyl-prolyl cis-trans isomerase